MIAETSNDVVRQLPELLPLATPSPQAFQKREFRETQLKMLKEFLLTKKIEGCTMATIRAYHDVIIKFIDWAPKDVRELTARDIRMYLIEYQESHTISKRTLDGIRLTLSSFYRFLEDEELIPSNPVRKIHKIKSETKIKQPFTDEELEQIRRSALRIRDLAIIDLLYSSGIRISECVGLDIRDIDFVEREMIVFGKGEQERICYFNAKTKIELLEYLKTRTDENTALFVTEKYPFRRLGRGGIRSMLKEIEQRTGIKDIHPHRFRRTLATNLLDKGMTIEQVQQILGHKKIETTLIYARVNQEATKSNHRRYTY